MEFLHYDTPYTVENQKKMLLQAGFSKIEKVSQTGGRLYLYVIRIGYVIHLIELIAVNC